MTNVVQSLQRTALDQTDAVAVDADREVSFSELWSKTDQFAGGLRDRDVTVGDAVGICLSSPVEFLVAVYGTLRNGSVPVVIPPSYDSDAIEQVAEDTRAQALVVDDRRFLSIVVGIPEIHFAVTVDNEQLLGVDFEAFLGGTGINAGGSRTGLDVIGRNDEEPAIVSYLDRPDDPVGVVRSHRTLQAAASAGAEAATEGPIETHLGCLPLTEASGLVFGATATIFNGGCYRAVTEWDPRAVAGALYEGEIDRAFLTSQQYEALGEEGLEPGHDGVAVVDALTDAASAPSDGSTRLVATEETGITHVRSPADVQQGRLGTPLDGARVRIADGGERGQLVVTGDTVMDAYYERPSLTDERMEEAEGAAWIRTEATGQVEDGEVVLVG